MQDDSLAIMVLRIYQSLLAILLSTNILVCATNFDEMKDSVFEHFSSIYLEGKNEIHMPFYTYHFPYAYDREKLKQLNQWPIGLGYGKGLNKDNGKWSGFYILSFADSHHDQQPSIVYSQAWPILGNNQKNFSVGYATFITARSDILSYFPFPGILPIVSLSPIESLKFTATYIPGLKHGTGNVLFFTSSYRY